MPIPQPEEISELIRSWSSGDKTALDRLSPLVYEELRRIARRYMRDERSGITLQTTAVVHEAFLRLVDARNVDWRHRAQFFTIAAQMMRRILVDANPGPMAGTSSRLTLADFARIAPRHARVMELRFLGSGSRRSPRFWESQPVASKRDWRFARSWLMRELCR